VVVRNIGGVEMVLDKSKIIERGEREGSLMPAALTNNLTPKQLRDMLTCLESLNDKK
jgi:hypothetical protein